MQQSDSRWYYNAFVGDTRLKITFVSSDSSKTAKVPNAPHIFKACCGRVLYSGSSRKYGRIRHCDITSDKSLGHREYWVLRSMILEEKLTRYPYDILVVLSTRVLSIKQWSGNAYGLSNPLCFCKLDFCWRWYLESLFIAEIPGSPSNSHRGPRNHAMANSAVFVAPSAPTGGSSKGQVRIFPPSYNNTPEYLHYYYCVV